MCCTATSHIISWVNKYWLKGLCIGLHWKPDSLLRRAPFKIWNLVQGLVFGREGKRVAPKQYL